jgi:uncharacterized RDD family membrane protein YckC
VSENDTTGGTAILEHRLDEEFDRLYARLKEEEKTEEVPWAGFFRRSCAFYIDVAILYALSAFLFYLTYVAYTVGLAAHGQVLDLDHMGYFLRILFFTGLSLVGGYFVLLSVNRTPITYGQALARLFATIPAAFFGLGFFWILVNREKRGWHDILARTWVIKG